MFYIYRSAPRGKAKHRHLNALRAMLRDEHHLGSRVATTSQEDRSLSSRLEAAPALDGTQRKASTWGPDRSARVARGARHGVFRSETTWFLRRFLREKRRFEAVLGGVVFVFFLPGGEYELDRGVGPSASRPPCPGGGGWHGLGLEESARICQKDLVKSLKPSKQLGNLTCQLPFDKVKRFMVYVKMHSRRLHCNTCQSRTEIVGSEQYQRQEPHLSNPPWHQEDYSTSF